MTLTAVLAVLVGTLILACSTVTPIPAPRTPNIDATVETKVSEALSAPEENDPRTTQGACKLTGGETVKSGWTREDTGNNSCNSCFCADRALGCTKMACPPHQVSSDSKLVLTPLVALTGTPSMTINNPRPTPTDSPTSTPRPTSAYAQTPNAY